MSNVIRYSLCCGMEVLFQTPTESDVHYFEQSCRCGMKYIARIELKDDGSEALCSIVERTMTSTAKLRQTKRLESGAVQCGDDWPGVFIRGDGVIGYVQSLDMFLTALPPEIKSSYHWFEVNQFLSFLKKHLVRDDEQTQYVERHHRPSAELVGALVAREERKTTMRVNVCVLCRQEIQLKEGEFGSLTKEDPAGGVLHYHPDCYHLRLPLDCGAKTCADCGVVIKYATPHNLHRHKTDVCELIQRANPKTDPSWSADVVP